MGSLGARSISTAEANNNRSPSGAPEALPAFLKFGRFQLVARLGKGGMGDVFLAVSRGALGANKLLVIKRLHDALLEDQAMCTLFLEEGRLATLLNHANVVQTFEVGDQDGVLYLSMEYLEGQPLSQLIRKLDQKPIDQVCAARIMSEALAGLHYAHELRDYNGASLGLVHRDVSPQNVLITYDGAIKVVDFGIAKLSEQHQQKTQEGILKGKVAYMSPEQVSGEVDRRSDVYSAGIVLWEFLTRQRLMTQSSVAKTLYMALHGPPAPRVSTIVPDIDPELDELVARALKRAPEERFQSAQEMRDALEAYVAGTGRFVRQEEISRLMCDLFKQRRERVANQVREFMVAAREARSAAELPSMKSTRGGGADPSQVTGEVTPMTGSEVSDLQDPGALSAPLNSRPGPLTSSVSGLRNPLEMTRPSQVGAQTLASEVEGAATPVPGRRSRLLLAGTIAAAACMAGLAWLALRPEPPGASEAPAPDRTANIAAAPAAPVVAAVPAVEPAQGAEPTPATEEPKPRTARPVPAVATPPGAARSPAAVAPPAPAAAPKPAPAAETKGPGPAEPAAASTPGKRKYRTDF